MLAYPLMFSALGLDRPECRVVLDYGCGTGRVAERVTGTYGKTVIAADASSAMLSIAQRKRPHPGVSYQQIGDDQRLGLPDDSVDAALTCLVFVTMPEAKRVQLILDEGVPGAAPGATYAILDVNPDTYGIPFSLARVGEACRTYRPGDPVEVRLVVPGGEDMVLVDFPPYVIYLARR